MASSAQRRERSVVLEVGRVPRAELGQRRPVDHGSEHRNEVDGLEIREKLPERGGVTRSEEHTSELQSLREISYAVFCLKAPHRGLGHPATVSTLVHSALNRAGLTPPTTGAHLLRHSLATDLLRHGTSLGDIGEVLRHQQLQTTEIYAKVDVDRLRTLAQPWPMPGGTR